jgi:hypothetical protein
MPTNKPICANTAITRRVGNRSAGLVDLSGTPRTLNFRESTYYLHAAFRRGTLAIKQFKDLKELLPKGRSFCHSAESRICLCASSPEAGATLSKWRREFAANLVDTAAGIFSASSTEFALKMLSTLTTRVIVVSPSASADKPKRL